MTRSEPDEVNVVAADHDRHHLDGNIAQHGSGGSSTSHRHNHRKILRKRKELDALVSEEKLQRKPNHQLNNYPFSHHTLLLSDSDEASFARSEDNNNNSSNSCQRRGSFLVAVCLVLIAAFAVLVGVALKLVLSTRKDLDNLYAKFNAVETLGTELPEKFHDIHVLLREIEKQQTALRETFQSTTKEIKQNSNEISKLKSRIVLVENRLSGSPELSSIPKDLAKIEASVASLGSSFEDTKSSIVEVKKMYDNLKEELVKDSKMISELKSLTHLPLPAGSKGQYGEPLSTAVTSILEELSGISSTLTHLNSSQNNIILKSSSDVVKVQSQLAEYHSTLKSITELISKVNQSCKIDTERLSGDLKEITTITYTVQDEIKKHNEAIEEINQNIEVVKGVQRKQEGSQLQLASTVARVKKQLNQAQDNLNSLTIQTTSEPLETILPNQEEHPTMDNGKIRRKRKNDLD